MDDSKTTRKTESWLERCGYEHISVGFLIEDDAADVTVSWSYSGRNSRGCYRRCMVEFDMKTSLFDLCLTLFAGVNDNIRLFKLWGLKTEGD